MNECQEALCRWQEPRRGRRGRGEAWTEQELAILHQRYGTMTASELAELLPNRTVGAVRKRAQVEGLSGQSARIEVRTEEEQRLFREFVESFLRTYKLARQQNIRISLSEMFGTFMDAWYTQVRGGQHRGEYLSKEEDKK